MCQLTASKLTQLMRFQRRLHSCTTLWSLPCSCCSWINPVSHLLPPCLRCPMWVRQLVPLLDGEAAPAHLKVKRSLVLVPWGSTSRVRPCGKPGQGTDLAENYPCLLAQLSATPGAWPGSPVCCTNTGQKKAVYGNEWPQKYMWRVH